MLQNPRAAFSSEITNSYFGKLKLCVKSDMLTQTHVLQQLQRGWDDLYGQPHMFLITLHAIGLHRAT
jgi:hypothetical protein